VLAGKGIAALQEAAVLAHHPITAPRVPLIGLYPDLLSLMLQLVLAAMVVGGFMWRSHAVRREG
jgi:high-affinity iron transporter